MFSIGLMVLDALLSLFGLTVILATIWGFYKFKTETVMADESVFLGYKLNYESTKGKELIFTMKKV